MSRVFIVIATVGCLLFSFGLLFAQDENRGRVIFEAHCIVCHGLQGKGDGLSSEALIPKPRDFTDPEVKASLTKDSVMNAILNGKPGTQMEGWKSKLTLQDAHSVMEYLFSLR